MSKTEPIKLSIYFIFIALIFVACNPQTTQTESTFIVQDSTKSRIDSVLQSLVDPGKVAGVSALIFEKNEEVYFNAFGFADMENQVPMDRNTIVRIYSMTKPVTGVALMKLYEEGAFQLDDPLEKYAPEFADMKVYKGDDSNGEMILEPANRSITIRDITRHTAGFPISMDTATALGKLVIKTNPMGDLQISLTEMAKRYGSLPLEFHPGEQWSYGPSVDVQAFLVERISGMPYEQFLKEKVLDPLGMRETRYVIPAADTSRFAALYFRDESGKLNRVPSQQADMMHMSKQTLTPGGFGLTSTLDDYMKFARMLVNEGVSEGNAILKPETVNLMSTNHLSDSIAERMWLPSKGQVGFGIDFAIRLREPANKDENYGVVGEYFWDGAASTLFWVDPENDITAVLFVQLLPFDKVKLHKGFRDAVYNR